MSTKPADPTQLGVVQAAAAALRVGDRIRLTPGSDGKRAWTVRARDERYIVATRIEGFGRGIAYTCIDTGDWLDRHYNGQGIRVVRSSLDTLGGGWDLGPNGEGCDDVLQGLRSGQWELSRRRVIDVRGIETVKKADDE